MVSSLTEQDYPGHHPAAGRAGERLIFVYGGTPSDPSDRTLHPGLEVARLPRRLLSVPARNGAGFPWRGRITYSPDMSSAATSAVERLPRLGATLGDFTPDPVNLTVSYSGDLLRLDLSADDPALRQALQRRRRGRSLLIGSELRGLETIRGPGWTKAGTTDGSGYAIWDYPFVAGFKRSLPTCARSSTARARRKTSPTLKNLITYSADWSSWMGWQHPGENGQWPHLDSLWASMRISTSSAFDNYLPLSDWTTGNGGLDATELDRLPPIQAHGRRPRPSMSNSGFQGSPTIYSIAYLKGNIEGGQYFDWFYNDGDERRPRLRPERLGPQVSLREGDRLAQARNPYYADQQILANKQLRWWWNNRTRRSMPTASGAWVPQGPQTEWQAAVEVDRDARIRLLLGRQGDQPAERLLRPEVGRERYALLVDLGLVPGAGYLPRRDDTIAAARARGGLRILERRRQQRDVGRRRSRCSSGRSAASGTGTRGRFRPSRSRTRQWGDTGNWQAGDWAQRRARGSSLPPPAPTPPPSPGTYQNFPTLSVLGWSAHVRPKFATLESPSTSRAAPRGRRSALRLLRHRTDLRGFALCRARSRAPGDRRLLRQMSGAGDAVLGRAARTIGGCSASRSGPATGRRRSFRSCATVGGYSEAVQGASGVSAVYLNGVAQPAGWCVSSGYAPAITFTTAPGAGVAVTADFGVLWLCRFAEDVQDFEEFMAMLWTFKTLPVDGAGHDDAAVLPDARRPGLERPQETDVRDHRRARMSRGARSATRSMRIRSGNSSSPSTGSTPRRVPIPGSGPIAAKPDGAVPAMPGPVRDLPLYRPDRQFGFGPGLRHRERLDHKLSTPPHPRWIRRMGHSAARALGLFDLHPAGIHAPDAQQRLSEFGRAHVRPVGALCHLDRGTD